MAARDEHDFLLAVDRHGFTQTVIGVYAHLDRWPGRTLTHDEALTDLRPQLQSAARMGFPLVRLAIGMDGDLVRRVAELASDLGVALSFEVQGTTTPDQPAVQAVLTLREQVGSEAVGLTLDTSLGMPNLPACIDRALARLGVGRATVDAVHDAWASQAPPPARVQAVAAALQGAPDADEALEIVMPVFLRVGRQSPSAWRALLPAVNHAHAKYWDPDAVTAVQAQSRWLAELVAAGYTGAVVSEWGGHELLDRGDADAWTVTAQHVAALRIRVSQLVEQEAHAR